MSFKPEGSIDRTSTKYYSQESADDTIIETPFYQVEDRPSLEISLLKADFNHVCWHFPDKKLLVVEGNYSTENGLLLFYNDEGRYLYTINMKCILFDNSTDMGYPGGVEFFDIGAYIFIRNNDSFGLIDPNNPSKKVYSSGYGNIDCMIDDQFEDRIYVSVFVDETNSFICSINAGTGKVIWKKKLEYLSDDYPPSARFCKVVGQNEFLIVTNKKYTFYIRKDDGSTVWQREEIYFPDEFKFELKPTRQGVVYAWNQQTTEGLDHNPLFAGMTTTMYAISIFTGETLWKLEYPGIADSYVLRSGIDDELMLLVTSSGVYETSHTKGIMRRFEKNGCRFSGEGWQYNGKVYAFYIKAPSWYKEPNGLKNFKEDEKFILHLMSFDTLNWKECWSMELFPCSHSNTGQSAIFIPKKNSLSFVFENEYYTVNYDTGKILDKKKVGFDVK